MKWLRGHIRWFDNLNGMGIVRLENGENIEFHYSADKKRFKKEFVTFNSMDIVEVKIHNDYNWSQVSRIKYSNWTTKEDLLSDKLLSFYKDNYNTNNNNEKTWYDYCLNNIVECCSLQTKENKKKYINKEK